MEPSTGIAEINETLGSPVGSPGSRESSESWTSSVESWKTALECQSSDKSVRFALDTPFESVTPTANRHIVYNKLMDNETYNNYRIIADSYQSHITKVCYNYNQATMYLKLMTVYLKSNNPVPQFIVNKYLNSLNSGEWSLAMLGELQDAISSYDSFAKSLIKMEPTIFQKIKCVEVHNKFNEAYEQMKAAKEQSNVMLHPSIQNPSLGGYTSSKWEGFQQYLNRCVK